jgi:hypothetical protein
MREGKYGAGCQALLLAMDCWAAGDGTGADYKLAMPWWCRGVCDMPYEAPLGGRQYRQVDSGRTHKHLCCGSLPLQRAWADESLDSQGWSSVECQEAG